MQYTTGNTDQHSSEIKVQTQIPNLGIGLNKFLVLPKFFLAFFMPNI